MTQIDMQNATALPAPLRSACGKPISSRRVRKHKCRAEVQIIRTRVVVCATKKKKGKDVSASDQNSQLGLGVDEKVMYEIGHLQLREEV